MSELLKQVLLSPSFSSIVILVIAALAYALWSIISKQLRLNNQTYDEVINERAKELMSYFSKKLDEQQTQIRLLEEKINHLNEDLQAKRNENFRLAMLNTLIINSKSLIKGFPTWLFTYPDNKLIHVSSEYKLFIKKGKSTIRYIDEYNESIYNSDTVKVCNQNNDKAATDNFWIGYEPLTANDIDYTYDFVILKVAIKNDLGIVDKIFCMALKVSEESKLYIKNMFKNTFKE